MLAIILGWLAGVIVFAMCVLLIVIPHNFDPVLMSADPEVIKKIPGPKCIPYLGNVLIFNVPCESKFSNVSRGNDLELIRADEVQSNFCIFSTVQFPW
jgi:hypothetical protein